MKFFTFDIFHLIFEEAPSRLLRQSFRPPRCHLPSACVRTSSLLPFSSSSFLFIIIISFYHYHHHFLSSLLPLSSSSFLFITFFTIIIVIISYYHTIAMSYKINPHHHIVSSSFLVICHKTMFALRTKISQSYKKFA